MAEPPPLESTPMSTSTGTLETSSGGSSFSFSSVVEGLDYDFVPKPDNHYLCAICLLVLRDPCQTTCGHRYCRNCILKWIRGSQSRCPIDNKDISEKDLFPDNFAKREIQNFNVRCPNSKSGCEVVTTIKHVNSHLNECPLALLPCPNKCSSILQRRDLDEHISNQCDRRNLQCTDCGSCYLANEMEAHINVCPQVRVRCQHCNTEVTRQSLTRHEEETCSEKLVRCDFYYLGCDAEIKRCDMGSHEQENLARHMNMLCWGLVMIYQHLGLSPLQADRTTQIPPGLSQVDMSQMMSGMFRSLQTSMSGRPHHSASDLRCPLQGSSEYFTPPPSVTSSLPTSASAVSGRGPASANTDLHQPPSADPSCAPSSTMMVEDTKEASLLRYRSDVSKSGEADMSPCSLSPGSGRLDFTAKSMASSWQEGEQLVFHTQKLVELQCQLDSMERTYIQKLNQHEQQLSEMEGRICHGEFYWKIKQYSKYHREAERGQTSALHSQPFYTSPSGYKLCLRANLNGVDSAKGSHLSLFVHFMQSEHDSVLDWPFSGRIVLSIIDQNEYCDLRHHVVETLVAKPNLAAFQRPSTPRNHKGFGYMEFVPLSALRHSYVRNDTLIIKAHVLPNTASH